MPATVTVSGTERNLHLHCDVHHPGGLSTFTTTLNIFDNGGGSPQLETMTATEGAEVSLSPSSLAFGTVTTNATLSVTSKDWGTTTLNFTSAPTITGTGAANSPCCRIARHPPARASTGR